MHLGILTGGGDCPGLNAVIRAIVLAGHERHGDTTTGFLDGWRGVVEGRTMALDPERCRDLLPLGGTILGSSRTNPFADGDGAARAMATIDSLGIDTVIAIGGEDTLGVADRLTQHGVAVVGVSVAATVIGVPDVL